MFIKFGGDMLEGLALAFGVLIGNWLIVPLVRNRSLTEGFFTGVIAGVIVLAFYAVKAWF